MSDWKLKGTKKDAQSITAEWEFTTQKLIDGVVLKEIKSVPKVSGSLTEIYRRDWHLDELPVDQAFQVFLKPGGISAWHAHEETTDRLFVGHGLIQIVLYDNRPDSPTRGMINEFKLGSIRPGLVVVPPKVWHGIRNIDSKDSLILNIVDRAYDYDNPDHWRVPHDSPEVPFNFEEIDRQRAL